MDRFLNTIEGVELLVTTKKECLSLVWKYGLTEEERENIALEDLTFENLHTIATNYSVYRESIISGFKRIKEVFIEDTKIFLEKFDRKIEVIDALQQRIVNTRRFSSSNFLGVTNYESVPYKVIIDQCEHLTHDLKDLKAETLDSKEYIWKDIFKDEITFKSFEKYIKVCIVEPYADLSYLFQRLTNEKLFLGTIPHMDFAEWMRSNEFISPRDFDKISEERGFRSYTKSKISERIQKFNTTFGL